MMFAVVLISTLALMSVQGAQGYFFDTAVGAVAQVGSQLLPEESMREGCRSVNFYNKEKDGGPLRSQPTGNPITWGATGLARIGGVVLSKSGMEKGCTDAGFYDKDLDTKPTNVNIDITVQNPEEHH